MNWSELLPTSVSLGYSTIEICAPTQLEDAQLGYAYDLQGNSLVGQSAGDWQANWLVIGHEGLCGDPIFVDRQEDGLPVYTAIHGVGSWEPVMIATKLQNFVETLKIIEEIAKGRETPVLLERNPISSDQKEKVLTKIRNTTQINEVEFWELLLGE